MQLVIGRNGTVRGIYGEEIDLAALGPALITRASHVEPDDQGRWLADLSPIGGLCSVASSDTPNCRGLHDLFVGN